MPQKDTATLLNLYCT